jgi:hypothetical protein
MFREGRDVREIVFIVLREKDNRYSASQSMTTVGIIEQVIHVTTADDLIRFTAKRSVFSAEDLRGMKASTNSPVKMIDFLLIGHSQPPVRLNTLVAMGVFSNRPPQSIVQLTEGQYAKLKAHVQLGFDV